MMKKVIVIIGFFITSHLSAYSQQSEDRKLSSFDKVSVLSEVNVYMTKGVAESVKINASGIGLNDVQTIVNGKTLQIELSRSFQKGTKVEIYLTYKEVREINVASAGKVSVQDTLVGDKVVLNVITSGELDSELKLKTIDVKVGQSGIIRLKGKVGSMDAKVTTGGILSAFDLLSDSTYVKVSSTGIAKVFVNSLLDADLKTGGNLSYTGKPKQKVIKTGIGTTITSVDE